MPMQPHVWLATLASWWLVAVRHVVFPSVPESSFCWFLAFSVCHCTATLHNSLPVSWTSTWAVTAILWNLSCMWLLQLRNKATEQLHGISGSIKAVCSTGGNKKIVPWQPDLWGRCSGIPNRASTGQLKKCCWNTFRRYGTLDALYPLKCCDLKQGVSQPRKVYRWHHSKQAGTG